jgi:cell division protein ZapA
MEQDKQIIINVWVAGRSYRIKINPEEEEGVRKAVKVAEERIMRLRSSYHGKDDQDFVAMCLLMYASDPHISKHSSNLVMFDIDEKLQRIHNLLDEAMSE